MLAFVKYLIVSTFAFAIVVLLCATVQQWDAQDAASTIACRSNSCT
jgi:hypothetical protein